MSKTGLVAQRELMENLRTRTFWLGILLFPLILVLSVVVPALLDRSTPTRHFAVVDRSGWMLGAIEERATLPDLNKVLSHAIELQRAGDPGFAELPTELQAMAEHLDRMLANMPMGSGAATQEPSPAETNTQELDPSVSDGSEAPEDSPKDFESQVIEGFATALTQVADGDLGPLSSMMPEEALSELRSLREAIRVWWTALPPEEAKEFGSTSKDRYRRLEIGSAEVAGVGENRLRVDDANFEEVLARLNQRVLDGELFAYFVIEDDPVQGATLGRYVSENLTDDDLRRWFAGLAREVVRERRLAHHDLDPEVVRWISEPVRFEARQLGDEGAEEAVDTQALVRQWAPPVFVYLLWVSIFSISQMLLSNTVEEKSNRIMEVLLSSVSPVQLMSGKILGIALTGLTMIGFWILFFFLAVRVLPSWMGLELDFDLGVILGDPIYLVSFVMYFLLGYLFFATLFVGIGSLCSSLKEAQNLQSPVTLMLLVPIFTMIPVARDPNGTLAVLLSYIPPFTPFVMMNRAAGPPSTFEYVATTLLLMAAIAFVLWGTAKVFRIGVLMTGKPPKISEVFKWVRAPVGTVPERKKS